MLRINPNEVRIFSTGHRTDATLYNSKNYKKIMKKWVWELNKNTKNNTKNPV